MLAFVLSLLYRIDLNHIQSQLLRLLWLHNKNIVTVRPAPHFRPIRSPGIANYSQETSLNEPGALDERLPTLVMQSFEGGGERLQNIFTHLSN